MSQRGPNGVNGANNGTSNAAHSSNEDAHSATGDQSEKGSDEPGREQEADSPRKPKSEREDAFDVGAWLVQGFVGLSEELRHSDLGLPEDFWVHAYAARREALLAARALVDAALETCADEEKTTQKKKPSQRGQVSIDFG
jgi:hypothetical protein